MLRVDVSEIMKISIWFEILCHINTKILLHINTKICLCQMALKDITSDEGALLANKIILYEYQKFLCMKAETFWDNLKSFHPQKLYSKWL